MTFLKRNSYSNYIDPNYIDPELLDNLQTGLKLNKTS